MKRVHETRRVPRIVEVLAVLLLVAGSIGVLSSTSASPGKGPIAVAHAKAQRAETVPPPGPKGIVQVYEPRNGQWREAPMHDVPAEGEFIHAGRLMRVCGSTGVIEWIREVDVHRLPDADRAFERGNHLREPEGDDVVRVLGSNTRHTVVSMVQPGEEFAFQGRVFKTRAVPGVPGELDIAYTGNTLSRVSRVFRRPASTLVDLTIRYEATGQEGVLSGTPEHPFFVPSWNAYVPMDQLKPGMVLHTSDNSEARVIRSTARHGNYVVHNLEVEHNHNYFVGGPGSDAGAVLVHNTCDLTAEAPPSSRAARYDTEQSALLDMAKRDKKLGVTTEDAQAYKDLGKEVGVPVRGPEVHPNRPHGKEPHIHVGPVDHIPVKPKDP